MLSIYALMSFDFFLKNLSINILLIIVFILLIVIDAFLAATEAAFSTSNLLRLKTFLEDKVKGAKKAVSISEQLEYAMVTIWILKGFLEITLTVIIGYFLVSIFSNIFITAIITVFIASSIIIFFGNFLPKQKAIAAPEKTALRNSGIMYFLYKSFYPLTFLLLRFKKKVLKNSELTLTPKVTEEDLESIIDTMETEGVFDEEDADLIQSAISLNEVTVYDIMTPRVDIIAVSESMEVNEIKEVFFENQFSRIPVYREDKDNIIGILSEKDFFTALLRNQDIDLEKLVSKPLFVSESTKVNDLIKEFQKLKKHLAVVVDEYGGTSGIVTMEDALEELVGEIYDEYDEEELEDIIKVGKSHYRLSPEMDIKDFFDYLEIDDIPKSQYSSIGGFVYSLLGGMPIEGQVVRYEIEGTNNKYELIFTIKIVKSKRIRLLELQVNNLTDQDVKSEEKDNQH